MCTYIYIYTYIHISGKQRDPSPQNNSLARTQCRRRRVEPLICRCLLSYRRVILRVRVPSFASELLLSGEGLGPELVLDLQEALLAVGAHGAPPFRRN